MSKYSTSHRRVAKAAHTSPENVFYGPSGMIPWQERSGGEGENGWWLIGRNIYGGREYTFLGASAADAEVSE